MNPLPLNAPEKVARHIDALFGPRVSSALPAGLTFEYSRRTGRIKNFSIEGALAGTLRTDGGIALTISGAQFLLDGSEQFAQNCIVPVEEAVHFVSEGRSLFCRHVAQCGPNVKVGSDVALTYGTRVIAVGVSLFSSDLMNRYSRGVAVKVRQGIKSRAEQLENV